jgi:aminoglycoside phosphotransferase (APT) family kinase protein
MIALDTGLPVAVADWLAGVLPRAEPPFSCERISGGYSMLTYRLTDREGRAWVLRHRRRPASADRGHGPDRAR